MSSTLKKYLKESKSYNVDDNTYQTKIIEIKDKCNKKYPEEQFELTGGKKKSKKRHSNFKHKTRKHRRHKKSNRRHKKSNRRHKKSNKRH